MKWIKPINEFNRTIGFRYSKPEIKFRAILYSQGKLTKKSFEKLLGYLDVPYENIEIEKEVDKIQTEQGEEEYNLVIQFDFAVYNESEIEKIVDEIRNGLIREFNVMALNFMIKELPRLK